MLAIRTFSTQTLSPKSTLHHGLVLLCVLEQLDTSWPWLLLSTARLASCPHSVELWTAGLFFATFIILTGNSEKKTQEALVQLCVRAWKKIYFQHDLYNTPFISRARDISAISSKLRASRTRVCCKMSYPVFRPASFQDSINSVFSCILLAPSPSLL